MTSAQRLQFHILGPLEVVVDGRAAPLGGLQRKVLLAVLLLEAGHVVPTHRLIDAVWGDPAPDKALATLRTHISELRRRIEVSGAEEPTVLIRQGSGYTLRIESEQVDANRARRLLDEARRALDDGDPVAATAPLQEAMALWRGEALADVSDFPFAAAHAQRLRDLRLELAKTKISADLSLGRHREVIGDVRVLVSEHPRDEGLRRELAIALYRDGRPDEAAKVCRDGLEALADQGLDSTLLRGVQEDVLRGAPALAWSPPRSLNRPTRAAPTGQGMYQLPPDIGDFTGRGRIRTRLMEALDTDAADGGVTIAAVAGKAGVGKTALAVHVAHQLRPRFPEALYVDLRGTQAKPLDPARVLSRFVQTLGVTRAAVPVDLDELIELYHETVANRRVLIILDNAAGEWQVRPLLPASPGNAVIITSRARLSGLTAAHWIVDVLRPDEAVDLLAKVAGADRVANEPEAARDIVGLCGYLPLAVQIAGRKLSGRQHWKLARLVQRLGNERDRLSELEVGDLEVRASFSLSYEGRPEEERRAFRLLALPITADFTPWVAAALLDIDIDEAEDVVDRLADAQLLEPRGIDATGQSRYRFHDLLRAFARERLGETESELVEQREALERLLTAYLTTLDAAVGTFSPGNSQGIGRRRGPSWSIRDPEAAQELVRRPLTWFGIERVNVLSLVEQAYATGMWETTWLLAYSAADLYEFGAHWVDWEQTHTMGLEAARRAGDRLAEATMLSSLGGRALVLAFEQAFWRLDAPGDDPNGQSAVEASGSTLARLEEATERFSHARDIFAALGDTFGEATALHGLADAVRGQGHFGTALEYFERSLSLFRHTVAPVEEARALVCLAMCHGDRHEVGDGVACLSTSLSIARDLENVPLEAYALRRLGDLYRHARQAENALTNYNESLRMLVSLPDPLWEPRILFRRGEILAQINDPVGARRAWQQATTVMRQTGSQELGAAERRISGARSAEPIEFIRGGRLLGDFDPTYFIDRVAASRRLVRILNTWTDLVTDANVAAFGTALGAALDGGALIQILLLDPDSLAAEQRAADLRGTVDVRGLIRENLWRLDALRATTDPTLRARMTVRVYSETPLTAYHRWDNGALVSAFPVGHSSAATTQHETTVDSPLTQFIEQRFESLWSPDGSVSLQDYLRLPLRLTSPEGRPRDYEVAFVEVDELLYVAHEELAGLAERAGPDGLIVELIGTVRHPARRRGRYRLVIPMVEPVGVANRLETKYGVPRRGLARLVDLGTHVAGAPGGPAETFARRGEAMRRAGQALGRGPGPPGHSVIGQPPAPAAEQTSGPPGPFDRPLNVSERWNGQDPGREAGPGLNHRADRP